MLCFTFLMLWLLFILSFYSIYELNFYYPRIEGSVIDMAALLLLTLIFVKKKKKKLLPLMMKMRTSKGQGAGMMVSYTSASLQVRVNCKIFLFFNRNRGVKFETLQQPSNETLLFFSEVYADPNHSSYEALEFVSGVSTTFTPKVCKTNCVFFINTIMHITIGLNILCSWKI